MLLMGKVVLNSHGVYVSSLNTRPKTQLGVMRRNSWLWIIALEQKKQQTHQQVFQSTENIHQDEYSPFAVVMWVQFLRNKVRNKTSNAFLRLLFENWIWQFATAPGGYPPKEKKVNTIRISWFCGPVQSAGVTMATVVTRKYKPYIDSLRLWLTTQITFWNVRAWLRAWLESVVNKPLPKDDGLSLD